MKIDSAIHSRLGPAAADALARALPAPLLRPLARLLARGYARHSRGRVRESIRHNQATLRGLPPDDPAVASAVNEVLVNSALSLVDLYKAVARGRSAVIEACHVEDDVRRRVDDCLQAGHGLVLVGLHMVGFEVMALRLGMMGYDVQALSDPRPTESYRAENETRLRFGLLTTPISRAAVADAETRLERNGVVLTGVDIPTPRGARLPFFGRTARMPTLHAELAIRHGSPIYLVVPHRDGDNRYRAEAGKIFHTECGEATPTRVKELTITVLRAAEEHIASRPSHWKMTRPLWREEASS